MYPNDYNMGSYGMEMYQFLFYEVLASIFLGGQVIGVILLTVSFMLDFFGNKKKSHSSEEAGKDKNEEI